MSRPSLPPPASNHAPSLLDTFPHVRLSPPPGGLPTPVSLFSCRVAVVAIEDEAVRFKPRLEVRRAQLRQRPRITITSATRAPPPTPNTTTTPTLTPPTTTRCRCLCRWSSPSTGNGTSDKPVTLPISGSGRRRGALRRVPRNRSTSPPTAIALKTTFLESFKPSPPPSPGETTTATAVRTATAARRADPTPPAKSAAGPPRGTGASPGKTRRPSIVEHQKNPPPTS